MTEGLRCPLDGGPCLRRHSCRADYCASGGRREDDTVHKENVESEHRLVYLRMCSRLRDGEAALRAAAELSLKVPSFAHYAELTSMLPRLAFLIDHCKELSAPRVVDPPGI